MSKDIPGPWFDFEPPASVRASLAFLIGIGLVYCGIFFGALWFMQEML